MTHDFTSSSTMLWQDAKGDAGLGDAAVDTIAVITVTVNGKAEEGSERQARAGVRVREGWWQGGGWGGGSDLGSTVNDVH